MIVGVSYRLTVFFYTIVGMFQMNEMFNVTVYFDSRKRVSSFRLRFFFLVRGVRSLALLLSCFWFLDFESSVVTVIIIFLIFAAMSQPKYALL